MAGIIEKARIAAIDGDVLKMQATGTTDARSSVLYVAWWPKSKIYIRQRHFCKQAFNVDVHEIKDILS